MGTDDYDILRETLPAGKIYEIVGLSRDLSEEEWMDIIEADENEDGPGYMDYKAPNQPPFIRAIDAAPSLLKSLGLDGNVLIVKILN